MGSALESTGARESTLRSLLWEVRGLLVAPLRAIAKASPVWPAVERDVARFLQPRMDLPLPARIGSRQLTEALRHPPLRSILYTRLRGAGVPWSLAARLLSPLYRGAAALEIHCDQIGGGMCSYHGFASIVIAERIGEDFLFAQQMTIGYDDRGGSPTIGDRVRVGAGAIVLGPITIGDDAVIGAGAVVVKDVPAASVVAGVPARVIEHATDRFGAGRSR